MKFAAILVCLLVTGCATPGQQRSGLCLDVAYTLQKQAPPPKLSSIERLPKHFELLDEPHPLSMPGRERKRLIADLTGIQKPYWPPEDASWTKNGSSIDIDWGYGLSGHLIHLKPTVDRTYIGEVDLYNDIPTPTANIHGLYSATAVSIQCR